MADYIPFEIQEDIIKRLPVKSLLKFIAVSKQWKSFITSSKFIADYHMDQQHKLVCYFDLEDSKKKYVSVVDDDTFPQKEVPVIVPASVKQFNQFTIVDSFQGLFCIYNFYKRPSDSGTNMVVIWNPTIRKSVVFDLPNVLEFPYQTLVGFGVCPSTRDVKLVKITYVDIDNLLALDTITTLPNRVEVFTLSSGAWRTPSINLPPETMSLYPADHVEIDGFIYWLALDIKIVDGELQYNDYDYAILSFDITSEEFTQIYLPASLATNVLNILLFLYKLRESLVVLEYMVETEVYGVWMMEHGFPKSFTKLFNISSPDRSIERVLGFRMNGHAIYETTNHSEEEKRRFDLEDLEPYSKPISYIGCATKEYLYFSDSYVKTLYLLDYCPDTKSLPFA